MIKNDKCTICNCILTDSNGIRSKISRDYCDFHYMNRDYLFSDVIEKMVTELDSGILNETTGRFGVASVADEFFNSRFDEKGTELETILHDYLDFALAKNAENESADLTAINKFLEMLESGDGCVHFLRHYLTGLVHGLAENGHSEADICDSLSDIISLRLEIVDKQAGPSVFESQGRVYKVESLTHTFEAKDKTKSNFTIEFCPFDVVTDFLTQEEIRDCIDESFNLAIEIYNLIFPNDKVTPEMNLTKN